MTICEDFARFIYQTKYEDLQEDVISVAKERILDTVGALIAGYSNWDYSKVFIESSRFIDCGDYKAIGSEKNEFSMARVAMINSTFAHSVELDDGHKNAGCHAGAVVVPTALAIAQKLGISGKDLILAVVLGYEITYRVAVSVNPAQIGKGFHPSSNCGVFGAVAVAAKLMSLSEAQIANALGQASMLASGTMEATISGQSAKCVQVGYAAYSGIQASILAKAGLEGCITALEGKFGLFNLQSEKVDVENVCKDLGTRYLIADTYNKMYPTCRHAQPGIEAVIELIKEHQFQPDEVSLIKIGTHEVAYNLTGIIQAPKDSGEAKFSLAYGAAVAMTEHAFGVTHLMPEFYNNNKIIDLAKKVECEIDETIQSVFPKKRGAKVKIFMTDGSVFEKTLFDLKGSPNNPVGWQELEEKFIANTLSVFSRAQVNKLIQNIKHIEEIDDTTQFATLMPEGDH
ncbi:MmgE/PrpD family protein [Geosporobacter ferrireducens]|uniref:MmgE/PrpD family protein n=1 Tax=Geosporobacter ferrireducens TaxID=1424294 RepID=UPI00139C248B|nr:MmgE/PrpD family protein [Geosporobacter ferrireducens]MTI56608.1 MmgE/PrpD family protein [Geosporobacter ferrireducens]